MAGIHKYAAPLRDNYTVTQEFAEGGHKGIDLAIVAGTPVVASAVGTVSRVVHCTKCSADKPSFPDNGIPIDDPTALKDQGWGFGFGNFVVIRYAWDALPDAMQAEMIHRNREQGFAYVIHAHLKEIDPAIAVGGQVVDGTQLGLSGNTGNSSGPHLHLEIRISTNGNAVSTGSFPSVKSGFSIVYFYRQAHNTV
jgi:murein DD-endopeptidase MepM/ murein hydrolase activator NlpD